MECFGLMVEHVPTDAVRQSIPKFMELALSGFQLDCSELREYSHDMFLLVAKALQQDFVQYLPYVVPLALESCNLDDGGAFAGAESITAAQSTCCKRWSPCSVCIAVQQASVWVFERDAEGSMLLRTLRECMMLMPGRSVQNNTKCPVKSIYHCAT